ncbi:MAG: hypothetical protein CMH28_02720 [Micavibrio sp.]|nr:hypothetical protein [Micavibrio sp.]
MPNYRNFIQNNAQAYLGPDADKFEAAATSQGLPPEPAATVAVSSSSEFLFFALHSGEDGAGWLTSYNSANPNMFGVIPLDAEQYAAANQITNNFVGSNPPTESAYEQLDAFVNGLSQDAVTQVNLDEVDVAAGPSADQSDPIPLPDVETVSELRASMQQVDSATAILNQHMAAGHRAHTVYLSDENASDPAQRGTHTVFTDEAGEVVGFLSYTSSATSDGQAYYMDAEDLAKPEYNSLNMDLENMTGGASRLMEGVQARFNLEEGTNLGVVDVGAGQRIENRTMVDIDPTQPIVVTPNGPHEHHFETGYSSFGYNARDPQLGYSLDDFAAYQQSQGYTAETFDMVRGAEIGDYAMQPGRHTAWRDAEGNLVGYSVDTGDEYSAFYSEGDLNLPQNTDFKEQIDYEAKQWMSYNQDRLQHGEELHDASQIIADNKAAMEGEEARVQGELEEIRAQREAAQAEQSAPEADTSAASGDFPATGPVPDQDAITQAHTGLGHSMSILHVSPGEEIDANGFALGEGTHVLFTDQAGMSMGKVYVDTEGQAHYMDQGDLLASPGSIGEGVKSVFENNPAVQHQSAPSVPESMREQEAPQSPTADNPQRVAENDVLGPNTGATNLA